MTANAEKLWLCLWLCLALIASMKLLNCTISVIHRSKQLRFCASDRAVYEDQGSAGASEAVHIWIRVWDWECLGMWLACVQTLAVVYSPDCPLQVSRGSATCCQESVGVCKLGDRWEGKREGKHECSLQRGQLELVEDESLCSRSVCCLCVVSLFCFSVHLFFFLLVSHTRTTYLFCLASFSPNFTQSLCPSGKVVVWILQCSVKVSAENCICLARCVSVIQLHSLTNT